MLNWLDAVVSGERGEKIDDEQITRVRTRRTVSAVFGVNLELQSGSLHEHSRPDDGHVTVLLEEAIAGLAPREGCVYVDGTFGGGGHSQQLLNFTPPVGRVIALDADRDAEERARTFRGSLATPDRFTFVRANFRDLTTVLDRLGIAAIDGLVLDLGMSSHQLDDGDRGFSFRADAPLDMRFDQLAGPSASELIATLEESDIAELIWKYGEDRQSRRIAAAIVGNRSISPINTTRRLATIVEGAVGGRRGASIHPATRTFQALRIAVNDELASLECVLNTVISKVAPGGRVVVISFHSLEDRIVKRWIESESRVCVCPPEQPLCTCSAVARLKRIGRTIRPNVDEQQRNPRSRSAIMRIAEKLPSDVASHR